MAPGPNALPNALPRWHWRRLSLDDKYTLEEGRVYLTGTQALVRLPMMQRQRDVAAGLNTGVLYLGLSRLAAGRVRPGACGARGAFSSATTSIFSRRSTRNWRATAVWGSQQLGLFPGAKYDGVFAMWYGKGPGVDRSGDALKHGNSAGTARAWRRAGARRRRPHLQILDPGAPVGARLYRRRDPGAEPGRASRKSSISASTAGRCRAIPAAGSGSRRSPRRWTARPRSRSRRTGSTSCCRKISTCRWAGSTSAGPTSRSTRNMRLHRYKLYAARGLRARQQARPHRHRQRRSRGSASSTTGKSYLDVRQALDDLGIDDAQGRRARPARLQGRRCRGRSSPRACGTSPKGSKRCWSSRKSARLSKPSSRNSSTTGRPTVRPRIVGKFDESRQLDPAVERRIDAGADRPSHRAAARAL